MLFGKWREAGVVLCSSDLPGTARTGLSRHCSSSKASKSSAMMSQRERSKPPKRRSPCDERHQPSSWAMKTIATRTVRLELLFWLERILVGWKDHGDRCKIIKATLCYSFSRVSQCIGAGDQGKNHTLPATAWPESLQGPHCNQITLSGQLQKKQSAPLNHLTLYMLPMWHLLNLSRHCVAVR